MYSTQHETGHVTLSSPWIHGRGSKGLVGVSHTVLCSLRATQYSIPNALLEYEIPMAAPIAVQRTDE